MLLEMEYYVLAFLGVLLHIMMHIKQRRNKTIPLSFAYFIYDKENWIRIFTSIISVVVLLIMAEEITDILGIKLSDGSPAKKLFAFSIGYLNHSIIRNVLKMYKK